MTIGISGISGLDLARGIGDVRDRIVPATQSRERSLTLKALEAAYRNAVGDASTSQADAARKAGTYADTPEFQRGLADTAELQGKGAQAALEGRINALRAEEGLPFFDPSAPEVSVGAEMPSFLGFAQTASTEQRAKMLKELEAAYGSAGSTVASSFRDSAGAGYQAGNQDYLRGMQSDVYAGTTGAQRQLSARINALREQQGVEPMSDASTSSQRYNAASSSVRGAVPARQIDPAASEESDTSEAVSEASTSQDTAVDTNAVTAAKKKTPKVL